MLFIDNLEISIDAHPYDEPTQKKHFGRVLDFKKGLNLVVGDNTTGKTTLVECLFYALGMEELIEGKVGNITLDKAVKSQFLAENQNNRKVSWYVSESYVKIRLSNSNDKKVTVRRNITSQSDNRYNVLYVWNSHITPVEGYEGCREFFIHNPGDHNEKYSVGFYAMLANFAQLPILQVPARNADDTTFYMQTLFAASYIEQKRGWADFFANIRSYNIASPKQRLIEYIMNYKSNVDMVTIAKLRDGKKKIAKDWKAKVNLLKNYLAYNGLFVDNLNSEIDKQKMSLEQMRIVHIQSRTDLLIYINQIHVRIDELEKKQNQNADAKNNEEYENLLKNFEEHKKYFQKYCLELISEKERLEAIDKQLSYIENEVRCYNSLTKVNNIITTFDVKVCPTCHQKMPVGSYESPNVVTNEQIVESREVLVMQKSFLSPIAKSLAQSIESKELNKQYLSKQLHIEKEVLLSKESDNGINLYPLSTAEQFELAESKIKITYLKDAAYKSKAYLDELQKMKDSYNEICEEMKILKGKDDMEQSTSSLLSSFKEYLKMFGYESNPISNVFLQEDNTTYKYLPIVSRPKDYLEGYFEEIRSDSSASDFIRSIWAYYISLLKIGSHHPGFLVMDEPCQHSMKESSLLQLFEACEELKDKQVILFCSSQPKTEEEDGKNSTVIEVLAQTMKNKGETLNYIKIDPKAIIEC